MPHLTDDSLDADLDRHFPVTRYSACTADACRQGRDPCPTPDACEQPEREPMTPEERFLLVVIWLASSGAMVSILYALIGWR